MTMIIRKADIERDALAIMDGARDFVSRMDNTDFMPETDDAFIEAIGRVLSWENVEVTVAEHDGRIVGGLGMVIGPHLWNPALTCADELFFWASKDAPKATALRLIKAVKGEMSGRVRMVTFKRLKSSPAKLHDVYRAMGLREVETAYSGVM